MTMLTRRIHFAFAMIVAGVLSAATSADPVPQEYKPGDLVTEDIISPVTIRVVNPEVSEALQQKSAAQVPLVFRHVVVAADEAETDLRASIDTARITFLMALRQALLGRMPNAGDVNSPAYANAVRAATLAAGPNSPPVARLAPLWVRGVSDTAIVEALLQPVRDVMAQPIVNDNEWDPLWVDQPVRLIRVKSQLEEPSLQDLETAGMAATAANLSSLKSARNVVESYFLSDQEGMAQFAAAFLRANTFPAPGLTEFLRSRRRDDIIGYDTYAAGQVIVKKGQAIDRKALAALAALREKKLIEALLTKVESKPSVTSPVTTDTQRFAAWFGAAGLVLLLILWRWGGRSTDIAISMSVPVRPVMEPSALLVNADAESWRTRALLAEQRAERAHEAIRQGALGWMREKIFRSIFHQRADLLSTQQMAEAEMVELERRLAQLLIPLQERIKTYENRIKELEETLAAQEGNDRRLIDARISRARQQLELERARVARDF